MQSFRYTFYCLFSVRGRLRIGIRCLVQAEGAAAGAYTDVQNVGLPWQCGWRRLDF